MTPRWSIPTCIAGLALIGALHAQQPAQPIPLPPLPRPNDPAAVPQPLRLVHAASSLAPAPQLPQPACAQACAAGAAPCGRPCGTTCRPTLIDPKSTILKAIDTAIDEASLDTDELRAATQTRLEVAVLLELARLHERHGQIAAADHYLRRILTAIGGEPIDPPPGE